MLQIIQKKNHLESFLESPRILFFVSTCFHLFFSVILLNKIAKKQTKVNTNSSKIESEVYEVCN